MMNNLQMLIDLLKSEKENAYSEQVSSENIGHETQAVFHGGRHYAFSFILEKAELLLLNEPKAITETAKDANEAEPIEGSA